MSALYFFLGGWAALIVFAVLMQFSGRLAVRLQLASVAVMGSAFMIAAVLLMLSEPWAAPGQPIHPTGVHRPSTVAIYSVVVFVANVGPQVTGLLLAAIAGYILHTAYIGLGRLK
jgi:hypothetical protein